MPRKLMSGMIILGAFEEACKYWDCSEIVVHSHDCIRGFQVQSFDVENTDVRTLMLRSFMVIRAKNSFPASSHPNLRRSVHNFKIPNIKVSDKKSTQNQKNTSTYLWTPNFQTLKILASKVIQSCRRRIQGLCRGDYRRFFYWKQESSIRYRFHHSQSMKKHEQAIDAMTFVERRTAERYLSGRSEFCPWGAIERRSLIIWLYFEGWNFKNMGKCEQLSGTQKLVTERELRGAQNYAERAKVCQGSKHGMAFAVYYIVQKGGSSIFLRPDRYFNV